MLHMALASRSPRRRELLLGAGYVTQVFPLKVSETIDENLTPPEVAAGLSRLKAETCRDIHKELKEPGFLILGADTIVVLGRQIYGKPANFSEAQRYLRQLSGKTHRVITGLTLLQSGSTKSWTGAEMTEVKFRPLSETEITDYIATGEPMDKAGAYAIQGEGKKFVESFTGSWSNVVGLPLERLETVLQREGWDVARRTPE